MKNRLSIILFLSLLSMKAISEDRARYLAVLSYSSELNIASYEIDPSGHVFKGDLGLQAKFCSPTSHFVCMITPELTFSIPKKKTVDEWRLYGWKFKELPSKKLMLLNNRLNVRVISAIDFFKKGVRENSCEHVFLYNEIQGLVADVQACDSNLWNATYFLKENNGIGSDKFNSKIKTENLLSSLEENSVFSDKVDVGSMESMHNCVFKGDRCS